MRWPLILVIQMSCCLLFACTDGPQQADPNFSPTPVIPTYQAGNGPVVVIDSAHHNFLTKDGRYAPFTQVLTNDGYTVKSGMSRISAQSLAEVDVLVIANALDRDRQDWQPPYGQAISTQEISALVLWLQQGGALLLVADHTPFPKVIEDLTLALDIEFSNGHVGPYLFQREAGTLQQHKSTFGEVTKPASPAFFTSLNTQDVNQVKTFGGSAFVPPEHGTSLLTLGKDTVSVEPTIPFEVTSSTPKKSISGWSQGAVLRVGKGKVAVFSEGMMFSSQLDRRSGALHGLRSPGAEQNERFLLNIMHWLSTV